LQNFCHLTLAVLFLTRRVRTTPRPSVDYA